MSDNPYTGLHGSDNRAAAKGWDEGFAAADERIARLLRESDVMEGEWLERTAQLVEALELIRAHARLDLSQRGIAEAERYAVIADAALAAADREAPDHAAGSHQGSPYKLNAIAYEMAAKEIAARFPNGGTHDG